MEFLEIDMSYINGVLKKMKMSYIIAMLHSFELFFKHATDLNKLHIYVIYLENPENLCIDFFFCFNFAQ